FRNEEQLHPSEHLQVECSTWLPLNVVSNGNASSSSQAVGVTKIAKSVIAPLAEQHVSVFMLSTYQTDFILVREKDLSVVIHTLAEEFSIFREEDGESVPVHSQDACNGLERNGKEGKTHWIHCKDDAPAADDLECIKFFSFSLIDGYVSLVMDTEAQRQFPADLLFTSSSGELWRMVRIGGQPLGFGKNIFVYINISTVVLKPFYICTFPFILSVFHTI
uniref:Cytosolic arginine sensor for mTORC1 subunit 1 n=1 Tax=Astyanax mexicanus TaxID=7994 RepID=A0A8B9HU96_ASTMX